MTYMHWKLQLFTLISLLKTGFFCQQIKKPSLAFSSCMFTVWSYWDFTFLIMGFFGSLYRWSNTLSCTICAAYPPSIESAAWRNYCGKRIQKRLWDFPPLPPPPSHIPHCQRRSIWSKFMLQKNVDYGHMPYSEMCGRCMRKRNTYWKRPTIFLLSFYLTLSCQFALAGYMERRMT